MRYPLVHLNQTGIKSGGDGSALSIMNENMAAIERIHPKRPDPKNRGMYT